MGTVDAFQGMEFDVVILSMTRPTTSRYRRAAAPAQVSGTSCSRTDSVSP